jgi:acetyltransferase-like isoleucine patch superfamily enzyme
MNTRKLASWAASRARKDALYSLDPELPSTALAEVFLRKALEAARGALRSVWVGEANQPCFVGRGVEIVGARQLSLGRGCIVRDYVLIDAISRGGIRLGDNVTLERCVIMKCTGALRELGEGITIGDNSSIGAFSYVGGSGGLTIGKNVLGGQRLGFNPENHIFDDENRPIREQGTTRRGIVIEDDCWLGSGAIFLDGVTVGRGSVVAAGSVVNRDVPAFSVVGGVPAKVLRSRQNPRPSRQP